MRNATGRFSEAQVARARFTERQIRDALRQAGSVKAAAALLGVNRKTVHEYINGYGIVTERRVVVDA